MRACFRYAANRPLHFAIGIMAVAFLLGGALFSIFEDDASLIDGWYWATVVMPTVGFGDFSPETIAGRWVYEYVVASGWIGSLILGGWIASKLVEQKIENHLGTEELDDDFDDLIARVEALKTRYVQKHLADKT
jgi:hypothetical protein